VVEEKWDPPGGGRDVAYFLPVGGEDANATRRWWAVRNTNKREKASKAEWVGKTSD